MKKTVSAYVYNTIERYPQILKTPKVEKAMGDLKCWMALRVNRGFDNSPLAVAVRQRWIDPNQKKGVATVESDRET